MFKRLNKSMPSKHRQFAAFITAHREERGLSMNQLAKELGIPRSRIHYWERGEHLPQVEVLEALARALKVSYEDLFVLAGYTHPKGLPSGEVFLRTSYPGASKRKLAEAERLLAELEAEEEKRDKRKGRRM
jgi:transcriptional regulator with XRE-family HTH domain